MTVQDLIDELEKVENKDLPLFHRFPYNNGKYSRIDAGVEKIDVLSSSGYIHSGINLLLEETY